MERKPISLRATIFNDEFPELYEQLERMLPTHKFRRRTVLLEILRKGCQAIEHGTVEASYGSPRSNGAVQERLTEGRSSPSEGGASHSTKGAPTPPAYHDVEIDPSDLDEIFGKRSAAA
ncbi:hypothetical protein CGK74_18460 [Thauera propionica]|uniref:Uncharacterized protein n=1 Tax=Thauera propionica TaxID=2019431 RepID=A0A235ETL1_9RHOO|nr:hypothetical protein [Thauera propionica]OYD52360.1 hypothetical protein CGK74_18460 [Thauera propionica]